MEDLQLIVAGKKPLNWLTLPSMPCKMWVNGYLWRYAQKKASKMCNLWYKHFWNEVNFVYLWMYRAPPFLSEVKRWKYRTPQTISGKAWPSNNRGSVKITPQSSSISNYCATSCTANSSHQYCPQKKMLLTSSHLSMIISAWSLHQTSQ